MAKFNADDQQSMVEPIEITIDGNTYKIEKITHATVKKVTAAGKRLELGEIDAGTAVVQQAAAILGVDEEVLHDVDVRKLGRVIRFVTDIVAGGGDAEEKN